MNKDLKIISLITGTLVIMFTTSLLLDVPLIQAQFIRQALVYTAIFIQAFIGFVLVKYQLMN